MPVVYPSAPEGISSLASRFWSKVNKDGPIPKHCPELGQCWVWTGNRHRRGYGFIKIGPVNSMAHRVSFFLEYGYVSADLEICHSCDNPACIRPSHLFAGTHTDNMQDAMKKGRAGFQTHPNPIRPSGVDAWVKGEQVNTHKITEQDVIAIRRRFIAGETTGQIARDYPVKRYTIRTIVCRKSWTYIPLLPGEVIPSEPVGIQPDTMDRMRTAKALWDAGKSIHEIAQEMNYSTQMVGQWLKSIGVVQDGRGTRKTHCPRGHEFTPGNTYVRPSGGARMCKACEKIRTEKYRRR